MRNLHGNYWVPDDGYTYLSNGEVWTDGLYLGAADRIENWHDTNDEPPGPEDQATAEDYEAALARLGVET